MPHRLREEAEQCTDDGVGNFLVVPPLEPFLLLTMGWNAEAIFEDRLSSKLLWLGCLLGDVLLLLLLRLLLLLLLMLVMVTPEDRRGHSVHSTRNLVTASLGTKPYRSET